MSLKTEFNKLKFDTRMLDINLNDKLISQSEIDAHLSSLEDCSSNAIKVEIDDGAMTDTNTPEATQEADSNIQQTSYGSFDPNNPLG